MNPSPGTLSRFAAGLESVFARLALDLGEAPPVPPAELADAKDRCAAAARLTVADADRIMDRGRAVVALATELERALHTASWQACGADQGLAVRVLAHALENAAPLPPAFGAPPVVVPGRLRSAAAAVVNATRGHVLMPASLAQAVADLAVVLEARA